MSKDRLTVPAAAPFYRILRLTELSHRKSPLGHIELLSKTAIGELLGDMETTYSYTAFHPAPHALSLGAWTLSYPRATTKELFLGNYWAVAPLSLFSSTLLGAWTLSHLRATTRELLLGNFWTIVLFVVSSTFLGASNSGFSILPKYRL